MKKLLIILPFLVFIAPNSLAQKVNKTRLTLTVGYNNGIELNEFEDFHGFHLGLNFFKNSSRRLTWDSQLSLNFSGDYETRFAISPNIGGRLYLNEHNRRHRYFFNLLTGPALILISGDDYIENLFTVGYVAGFHMQTQRWQVGLSLERPEVIVFKVGYQLISR